MSVTTIFEFDALAPKGTGNGAAEIPQKVFEWLDSLCLRLSEETSSPWLKPAYYRGHRAVRVTNYVGVIRSPDGYQIEVLPKVGKAAISASKAREQLIRMLGCLGEFRHMRTDVAQVLTTDTPLFEVFVLEFLRSVEHVVKRGLRSDYVTRQDNLFAIKGKLIVNAHVKHNLCRADRFFVEYDEFSSNRAENRLLHSALRRVLSFRLSQPTQQLARELSFVFADFPESSNIEGDFRRVRLDRGMGYYADSLDWARLILEEEAPLTGRGDASAPSLLFPMEAVFEAYVAKHLARQVAKSCRLRSQTGSHHLVRHRSRNWFKLKPDLLLLDGARPKIVLDTKWKVLDSAKSDGSSKYGLSQADFYQLHAYGHTYLDAQGDVALIYPKTDAFAEPLPVFEFPDASGLRLWVLPFCLESNRLRVPDDCVFRSAFNEATCATPSYAG